MPDASPSNTEKAELALAALTMFAVASGQDIEIEREDVLVDMVANMRHLCDDWGITQEQFELLMERASEHYDVEIGEDAPIEDTTTGEEAGEEAEREARAAVPELDVTFQNVTITVRAKDPQAAYTRLCDVLEPGVRKGVVEYTTDTYTLEGMRREHSTSKLFPE